MSVFDLEMLTGYEPKLEHLLVEYGGLGLKRSEFNDRILSLYFDKVNTLPQQPLYYLQGSHSMVKDIPDSENRENFKMLEKAENTGNLKV